jgi:hypothetical protein
LSSIADSGTVPARTAATSLSPHGPWGPGITRSRPATALGAVDVVADQSDTTTPPKSHSPLSRSWSSGEFAVMVAPFTEL